ncbi:zinc ribbon domain-containing protein [[Collinsella] massiliensis]|uniref:Zinc ribbon domain-containing protein n=1 Tax=[Collinsella] massiliensis TaxID=1232426 RepID=A0A1Y3XTV4_9ACTN|nr:zinc ribbon domain-containing protein [[Collinsella] massiliensis]OUN88973.1 zinc ribbon domain-containing protein [[Collinsella] massiliensis]
MGFLDDVQASLNRGVAGANRGVETLKIKNQMNDAMKRRQQLAAQLGASLYEVTKDDPAFRTGREQLFDGIAQIDAERASLQAQLDEIERQNAASQQAATVVVCPFCHTRISASDMFCAGCGKSMAEIMAASGAQAPAPAPATPAAPAGSVCPKCGAPVNPGDAFCMSCGEKLNA